MKEGGCVVRGWFVDTQGAVPAAVVLRVNGASYGTDDLERTSRPDVQRHFGLAEPTCGFIATIAVPGVSHPRELGADLQVLRSEEHTSELQSLMRISYAVFCLKKKMKITVAHTASNMLTAHPS